MIFFLRAALHREKPLDPGLLEFRLSAVKKRRRDVLAAVNLGGVSLSFRFPDQFRDRLGASFYSRSLRDLGF